MDIWKKQHYPSQPCLAFHTETSLDFSPANQMTGVYMKCNTRLKWVNATQYIFHLPGTIINNVEIIPHRFLVSTIGSSNLKLVVPRARATEIFVKTKNIINNFIFTQNGKINYFAQYFVAFTISLDESINLLHYILKMKQEFFHVTFFHDHNWNTR